MLSKNTKTELIPNENIVKAAIINNYARITHKPFIVCSELTILTGQRIADLVFCKGNLSYAYEVKAQNDDMRRLQAQLESYSKLFDYIYIATTSNHIDQLSSIPDYVGIVIYSLTTNKISYKRRARRNHLINKNEILASIPISYIRRECCNSQYTRLENSTISLVQAHNIFMKHLSSKRRWSNTDLRNVLHFEDIIMNTDYLSLDY